ncbi:hypothetical protein [Chamaesiphon sp.]|uniref:hypothetical protein n=1 Tax=Chamaesiphon sp. TaxID=2814140 RepID=UPI0035944767
MNELLIDDKSKHKPKRNAFQTANDRKLAIELLSAGKPYSQIAKHISSIREYSLSAEQIRYDVGAIQEELIASAMAHGLEAIAEELDKIENLSIDISRRIATFRDDDPKVAPFLKQMESLAARKTYLTGGDNYIKAQDLNQAIERVTRAGFKIVDPIDALTRDEPLDIQAEVVNAD